MITPDFIQSTDDDVELEYFAIEAADATAKPDMPKALVAVVADVSPELALSVVSERWGHLKAFRGKTLSARIVDCPGVHDPLPAYGWIHFDGPESAKCPACRRTLAVIPKGYRWSLRLLQDPRGKGTHPGHGTHRCQRSACRKDIEIVVSQAPAR